MDNRHQYQQCWEHNGFHIIECQTCGFKHIYPIPNPEVLERFYRDTYYQQVKPVADQYRDADADVWRKRIMTNRSYQNIYELVSRFINTEEKIMMDIGCGYDGLTGFFAAQGWTCYAVEPSREVKKFLSLFGVTVISDSIENMSLRDLSKASFINIQFVLEHLPDPASVLRNAYDALLPGGILRIAVPNDFSIGQLAYREYFQEGLRWVVTPDHINYFNFDTLSNLLQRIGFTELYRTTNFPLEFLLLGGINYYADESAQKKVGPFVSNFEEALINTGRGEKLRLLYENLAKSGFGRSIFMYAQKK